MAVIVTPVASEDLVMRGCSKRTISTSGGRYVVSKEAFLPQLKDEGMTSACVRDRQAKTDEYCEKLKQEGVSVFAIFQATGHQALSSKAPAYVDTPTHAFFDFRDHVEKQRFFPPEDQHKLDAGRNDACIGPAIQLARAANEHGVQAPAALRENQVKMLAEEKRKEEKRQRMVSPKADLKP